MNVIGETLITEMSASVIDEDILKGGMMSGEAGQGASGYLEMRQQQRQSFVQVLDGQ